MFPPPDIRYDPENQFHVAIVGSFLVLCARELQRRQLSPGRCDINQTASTA